MADECMKKYDKDGSGELDVKESEQLLKNVSAVMINYSNAVIEATIKALPPTQEGE